MTKKDATTAKKEVREKKKTSPAIDPAEITEIEDAPSVMEDATDVETDNTLTALKLMSDSKKKVSGPAARPGRFAVRRSGAIHSVDNNDHIVDDVAVARKAAEVSIYQSALNKRILTGNIFTVRRTFDRSADGKIHYYVAVMNGPYQVIIPVEQFADTSMEELCEMYRRRDPNKSVEDTTKIYLQHRMGAEIDYVVSNIPKDGDLNTNMVVAGNRVEAMRRNRIHYWYGTTTDGQEFVKIGDKAQARVVVTARNGIRVEIYGVETFIPVRELSWNLIQDAREIYQVGSRVKVKITDIKRDAAHDYGVTFEASIKQASEDPRDQGMRLFTENGVYTGTINYIRVPSVDNPNAKPAVFVKLAEGVQCLCPFPTGSVAPVENARVYVAITNRDEVKKFLYGVITHICT